MGNWRTAIGGCPSARQQAGCGQASCPCPPRFSLVKTSGRAARRRVFAALMAGSAGTKCLHLLSEEKRKKALARIDSQAHEMVLDYVDDKGIDEKSKASVSTEEVNELVHGDLPL